MNLIQNQKQFSKDVATLINHIFDEGFTVTLGEAWRTKEQAEWNAKHGTGIAKSLHCDRLAIDLNIFDGTGRKLESKEDYERFGCFWENLDAANRWGGRFTHLVDSDHFERQEK